jgi:hypothetical protein
MAQDCPFEMTDADRRLADRVKSIAKNRGIPTDRRLPGTPRKACCGA